MLFYSVAMLRCLMKNRVHIKSELIAYSLRLCVLLVVIFMGCATGGRGKSDRRAHQLDRASVLVDARRLPDALIEEVDSADDIRDDIDSLREKICDRRLGDKVIFYQVIVAREWHYYWLCSSKQTLRGATRRGARDFGYWLDDIKRKARNDIGDCAPNSRRLMFKRQHKSGVIAGVYCDDVLLLKHPDRSKHVLSFKKSEPSLGRRASCPPCPRVRSNSRCPSCPPQRACPTQRRCPPQRACPPRRACPPVKRCPAKNTPAACAKFGRQAFWKGVDGACKKICDAVHKRCRAVYPNTAACQMIKDHCVNLKGVCRR